MSPTAQTLLPETTATPFNSLNEVPTLGLTTLQFVPFQCSISACWLPLELMDHPTAQMSVAETMATAVKLFLDFPALGLLTTFQLVPFHCSVSVRPFPSCPTAQTSEAEAAATPNSRLPAVGLETMFQAGALPVPIRPPTSSCILTPLR